MPGFQNLFEPFASAWGTPLMLLQLGFTIWMLADANSRHVEYFWFWAILFFQPLGPWIYFVVVKLRQGSLRGSAGFNALPALFEKKLSLKELQYRVERAPTMMNRLALAERLKEKKDYTTAIGLLRAALVQDDTYCPALYGNEAGTCLKIAAAKCPPKPSESLRMCFNSADVAVGPVNRSAHSGSASRKLAVGGNS